MRVNLKIASALGILSVFMLVLPTLAQNLVSGNVVGSNQLLIENRQTNTSALVTFYPNNSGIPGTSTTVNPTTPTVPVNPVVPPACVNLLATTSSIGLMSPEVVKLQNFLESYAGANLNGLGYFGPATQASVRNLQYTYGLTVNGTVDNQTLALINNLNCGNIARKTPMFYGRTIGKQPSTTWSSGSGYSGTITTGATGTVYPNPTIGGTVSSGGIMQSEATVTRSTTTATTSTSTATSSFLGSFADDWEKIKENYKAYLLVFVLVLALFWFLRKAATE